MEEIIDKVTELSLHGIDYILKISANSEMITIEIEQKTTGDIWKNSFLATYIEEITQKTGNFKKYQIFLKMLLSALQQNSDSVFIDILSYQDLEMLKSRKNLKSTKGSGNAQSSGNAIASQTNAVLNIPNNKRYIILSYVVEFDKVHYPLPLNFEDNPDIETLRNTIRRLRIENEEIRRGLSNNRSAFTSTQQQLDGTCNNSMVNMNQMIQIKQENELLRLKIKKLEEQQGAMRRSINGGFATMEQESLLNRTSEEQSKELKNLKDQFDQKEREISQLKNEIYDLKCQLANAADQEEELRKATESQKLLLATREKLEDMENTTAMLMQEVNILRNNEAKYQARISDLESELESALSRHKTTSTTRNRDSSVSSANKRATSVPISSQSPMRSQNKKINATPKHKKKNSSSNALKRTPQHGAAMDSETESSRNRKIANKMQSPLRSSTLSSSQLIRKQTPKNSSSKKQFMKSSPKIPSAMAIKDSPSRFKASQSSRANNPTGFVTSPSINSSALGSKGKKTQIVSSFKKGSTLKNSIGSIESDEDKRLMKKLEELKQRNNKENYDSYNNLKESTLGTKHNLRGEKEHTQSVGQRESNNTSLEQDSVDIKLQRLQQMISQAASK